MFGRPKDYLGKVIWDVKTAFGILLIGVVVAAWLPSTVTTAGLCVLASAFLVWMGVMLLTAKV